MRLRVVAAVAAVTVLAGCSTGGPGAAVVVGGTTISMSHVDETAEVICQLSVAQQPEAVIPGAEVRGQAATELALTVVAEDVAEREGITVRESDVRVGEDDRRQIAAQFPDLELDTVIAVLEDGTRVARIAEALGEEASGEEITEQTAAAIQQAGRELLLEALAETDPEFSPRLEIGELAAQVDQPGPLAVTAAAADDEDPAQPVATQTCTA
ncbi:hypothetical protein ACHAAC_01445 [Aeromicrobium sp. CF4.19]|uniref:hypothetical protein n=1 Tax=Aeromicrobium sp. CF4.19 TaxID=3373082 RepID=UPI003EE4F002